MNNLIGFMFLAIIGKIKCQQVLHEELAISTQEPGEKIDFRKAKIERRFLEDLSDTEWHVAHLRTADFDGRRNCKSDTFEDIARRYRKMLKEDGARVEYVSANALPVNPEDLVEETCTVQDDDIYNNETIKATSGSFIDATTVVQNITSAVNTTESMKVADTTPPLDFKATTVKSKVKSKKKMEKPINDTRRASEYMFSSVEYYDESTEFDPNLCPDAVEIITLQIDQLRSYDLECEMTVEWRSLE